MTRKDRTDVNLDGVTGDARKRIEAKAEAAAALLTFDRHPECLLCGRRDLHIHSPQYLPVPAGTRIA